MDRNRKQYSDYYEIQSGEIPRDLFILFDDNAGNSYAKVKFENEFRVGLGSNGRRNVGVGVTHFSAPHTVQNLSLQNQTSQFWVGDTLDSAKRYTLRDAFYESGELIQTEMAKAGADVRFTQDHLGLNAYAGQKPLFIPIIHKERVIPDSLAHKFGFMGYHGPQFGKEVEECLESKDDMTFVKISPGDQGRSPGDLFGPLADLLLLCDQCVWTKQTQRVLDVFTIASYAARAHCTWTPAVRFRPIHDLAVITHLDFRLSDRANRPVFFVSGIPSATIELIHLS